LFVGQIFKGNLHEQNIQRLQTALQRSSTIAINIKYFEKAQTALQKLVVIGNQLTQLKKYL
jgi:hypothetical protein